MKKIRLELAALALGCIALGSSGAALAQNLPLPRLALPTVAPPDLQAPLTDPVAVAVAARLSELRASARLEPETTWLARLVDIYSLRRENLFWIADGKLNSRAEAVVDEIKRAGDYGLDAARFQLPKIEPGESRADDLARAEVQLTMATLKYAFDARGGRVDPSELSDWLDQKPRRIDPKTVLADVTGGDDAAAALRKFHPQHPQFELLRQAYLRARGPAAPAPVSFVAIPDGPRLRPGITHPHVALVRQRLGVASTLEGVDFYDEGLAVAVRDFVRKADRNVTSTVGPNVRALLNRRATPPPQNDTKRLLVNMERWRYLPDNLGQLHVWNNLPEFETRVFKDAKVIHQERIIIGRPDTQTPVFSDAMRFVVFQPDWTLPPSLKVKKLLGALQDGDDDILQRSDMKIVINGRDVEPSRINWDKVDIRNVPIIQSPGPSNPLGQMKFMFPNRHAVYMHDTPDKGYFSSATRTFSSGCIRVRNPRKLAELVMGEDKGWTASDVTEQLSTKTKENSRVDLGRSIPVHNVYFTMIVQPDGRLQTLSDIYGHDRRMIQAMDGRPVASIKADDPALKLKETIDDMVSGEVAALRPKTGATSRRFATARSAPPSGFGPTTIMRLQAPPVTLQWQPPIQVYRAPASRDWIGRAFRGNN